MLNKLYSFEHHIITAQNMKMIMHLNYQQIIVD